MNILIVGGGGREHALAWKIAQSDRLGTLYCAPGNAGTGVVAENVPIASDDLAALLQFAKEHHVDMTLVGPEGPLCSSIVDRFDEAGLRIFGPQGAAATLEGDKAFAKQLMKDCAIPTAEGRIFDNYRQARSYIATRDSGLVVKAAGLAQGKGVVVCEDPSDALLALERIMVDRIFGAAGDKVVVEERLTGSEISLQALVDGSSIYVLETAQDHKPIGEGDTGPNTGGMGAYSPEELLGEADLQRIIAEILVPAIDAMNRRDTSYRGVLYAGLMLTRGGPKLLEFNCRFGDPETQVLVPRLQTDLVDVLAAVIDGTLNRVTLDWDPRPAVCVVLAARGYPGQYQQGRLISGLDQVERLEDVRVFHAGTKRHGNRVVTAGGRVLGITALGDDIRQARDLAYRAVDLIHFEGAYCRRDIAYQALSGRATLSKEEPE